MTMRVDAILNMSSGTLRSTGKRAVSKRLERAFCRVGHEIEVTAVDGENIRATIETAASRNDTDVILVGGGDGTISLAAGLAWQSGKCLAVLPAGTMNLFARSLGIPLEWENAIAALAGGDRKKVDIATVNGHPFVHQTSVGLQARAIRMRNEMDYGSRQEKILASVRAAWNVVLDPPSFPVLISRDGEEPRQRRVSAVSVSNNPFGKGHLPYADSPAGGELGVYVSDPVSALEALTLGSDIMLGSWHENETVTATTAHRVCLEFPKKPRRANAVIDGELVPLEDKIEFEIHPEELEVLVPKRNSV